MQDYKSKGQLQVHYLSLMNFNQDDGYGNLINTQSMNFTKFVIDFVYDKFYFCGRLNCESDHYLSQSCRSLFLERAYRF